MNPLIEAVISSCHRRFRFLRLGLLALASCLLLHSGFHIPVYGQSEADPAAVEQPSEEGIPTADPAAGKQPSEADTSADSPPPSATNGEAPMVKAAPPGQYVLEFNRSPVVQDRLRFEGIYDEARLWFTRPRDWEAQSVKVQLRYRHSAALYATRSNMTVLVNGTSIGSVPLNRKQGELGNAIFEIPSHLIRDYNEVVVAALQNNSPTCTQDPFDPSLWSEVLPDSKLVFDFIPKPVTLDFQQYPASKRATDRVRRSWAPLSSRRRLPSG
ncbi:MAG: cellulose biosynthesis cyclic di-GMP-binding regulatory protein BcsB [Leptolyngbya sp. SIO1D8]|nr:cellulose biosynthesis cyclic di-GMP-binding regulatory protein BcsB [Leptolyngbya sp. SIO1D8]